jgi:hypothetical protein
VNSELLAALGQRLQKIGLTERGLKTCFGVGAVAHLPRVLPQREGPGPTPPPAAVPLWLFCAGRRIAHAMAREILGPDLARMIDLGLLDHVDGDVVATRLLAPIGPSLAMCDRFDEEAADRVLWPDDSSHHLLGALPGSRVGRWLDVGSGPAWAPLAVPGLATGIHATDLSPRAVAQGKVGLGLSNVRHATMAVADLFAGAGGGWNLITFNAPIPTEAKAAGPDEPGHRRAPAGAKVLERFWAGAPAAIADGGEVVVHSWVPSDPLGPVADLPGAVVALRYAREPGFAITAWRPGAPRHRAVIEVELTAAHPHVQRVTVDQAWPT